MSAKLKTLKRLPVPDWQKLRLQRWLHEWHVEDVLAEQADLEAKGPDSADRNIAWDKEPSPIEISDIRILWPMLTPAAGRPVYVAVLEKLENGHVLIVPFGRFSEPAMEGELLTQREAPSLRVLCIWNATSVSPDTMAQSWQVDCLTDSELQEVLAVRAFLDHRDSLPDSLQLRTGPAVYHHADPRIVYMRQETRLLADLAAPLIYPLPEHHELPKAADPRAPYGSGPEKGPDSDA